MNDKAHKQTDEILSKVEYKIAKLYRQLQRKINREVLPLIETNKDKAIKMAAIMIASTNEEASELINQNSKDIYGINFKFSCDGIVKKLNNSGV